MSITFTGNSEIKVTNVDGEAIVFNKDNPIKQNSVVTIDSQAPHLIRVDDKVIINDYYFADELMKNAPEADKVIWVLIEVIKYLTKGK